METRRCSAPRATSSRADWPGCSAAASPRRAVRSPTAWCWTSLVLEFQITKEHLGEDTHLVFLGSLFAEVLPADTWVRGKGSTVASVIDGSLHGYRHAGIAGVANTGTDRDWTGSHFNQANWYAFGRLADPRLSPAAIAEGWTRRARCAARGNRCTAGSTARASTTSMGFLATQEHEAVWWRDAVLSYFQTFSHLPVPDGHAPFAHPLSFYRALPCPADPRKPPCPAAY